MNQRRQEWAQFQTKIKKLEHLALDFTDPNRLGNEKQEQEIFIVDLLLLNLCLVTRPSDDEYARLGKRFFSLLFFTCSELTLDEFRSLVSTLYEFIERWNDQSPAWIFYQQRIEQAQVRISEIDHSSRLIIVLSRLVLVDIRDSIRFMAKESEQNDGIRRINSRLKIDNISELSDHDMTRTLFSSNVVQFFLCL